MKDNRTKKEHASTDIKQRVLTLDLAPGAPMDEAALSQQYGLSRTPLREVFQRLAGEGYINLETNRGATVSSMDFDTMRNFFHCAPMIYSAIARLATENATTGQIGELKKIQTRFRKSMEQNVSADMAVHNHCFHEQLGVMAASPYLTPSLGRLLIDHTRMSHRFFQIQHSSSRKRIAESCKQHDAMIDAIEKRAPAVIVDLTLKHWELSRSEMDKYVMPEPLPLDTSDHLTVQH